MYTPVDWPVPDLVSCRARTVPDRPALVDAETGETWTYGALADGAVGDVAEGIRDMGLDPGDHLGVVAEGGARLAMVVHAAAWAGVRLVPLPPDAPPAVVADRCTAASVDGLVGVEPSVARATPAFTGPSRSLATLGDGAVDGPPHEWRPDDVQWLVFTSGTTGEPRPVQLTAGNLVASATASALRLGVDPGDRWLACLPMHHVGGLAPVVRSALYGTTVVVQAGFDPGTTAAAIVAHDVTGISLVPTMLDRLLDDGWSPPASLRFVLLGGAPAPPGLIDGCEAADVPVHPTYGMTETASQVATARPREAFDHRGTVGRPLAGVEVGVHDERGAPVPAGEPGELVVSGPTVSPGYLGDDAATAERFTDDGFRTRDRGYRDAAGRLWVLGRVDDAIVSGGETVQPGTVESVLLEDAAVAEAAVVGLPDDEWGEAVAALVVGATPGAVDVGALRARCRRRLEPHAVPKVVATTDAIPRTASGTVDRAAVRDRLCDADCSDGL